MTAVHLRQLPVAGSGHTAPANVQTTGAGEFARPTLVGAIQQRAASLPAEHWEYLLRNLPEFGGWTAFNAAQRALKMGPYRGYAVDPFTAGMQQMIGRAAPAVGRAAPAAMLLELGGSTPQVAPAGATPAAPFAMAARKRSTTQAQQYMSLSWNKSVLGTR